MRFSSEIAAGATSFCVGVLSKSRNPSTSATLMKLGQSKSRHATSRRWRCHSILVACGCHISSASRSTEPSRLPCELFLGVRGGRFSSLVRIQHEAYILTLPIVSTVRLWSQEYNLPINTSTTNSSADSLRLETKALERFDIPWCQRS